MDFRPHLLFRSGDFKKGMMLSSIGSRTKEIDIYRYATF